MGAVWLNFLTMLKSGKIWFSREVEREPRDEEQKNREDANAGEGATPGDLDDSAKRQPLPYYCHNG